MLRILRLVISVVPTSAIFSFSKEGKGDTVTIYPDLGSLTFTPTYPGPAP